MVKVLAASAASIISAIDVVTIFNKASSCKFVLAKDGDTYIVVLQSFLGQQHADVASDLLNSDYEVLGGGWIEIRSVFDATSVHKIKEMCWDSYSMKNKLGYDRPENPTILKEIMDQINKECVDLP